MSKRILVVEDQEDNRRIMRDLLSASGYAYIEATTGDDGLAAARILLMGFGRREELTLHRLREAVAHALKALRARRLLSAVLPLPEGGELPFSPGDTAEASVLGGLLGLSQITELGTTEREKIRDFNSLALLTRVESEEVALRVAQAEAVARGVSKDGRKVLARRRKKGRKRLTV